MARQRGIRSPSLTRGITKWRWLKPAPTCQKNHFGRGEKGQSTILDRFGARRTRLAWPLGSKSLGRDRRTDGRSRWRGNQTHAPPGRTKMAKRAAKDINLFVAKSRLTA